MDLETEHPGVKVSMLKALSNVATRHLLDTRLNPPAELRARVPQSSSLPGAVAADRSPCRLDKGVVAGKAGGRRLRILQAEELSQPS